MSMIEWYCCIGLGIDNALDLNRREMPKYRTVPRRRRRRDNDEDRHHHGRRRRNTHNLGDPLLSTGASGTGSTKKRLGSGASSLFKKKSSSTDLYGNTTGGSGGGFMSKLKKKLSSAHLSSAGHSLNNTPIQSRQSSMVNLQSSAAAGSAGAYGGGFGMLQNNFSSMNLDTDLEDEHEATNDAIAAYEADLEEEDREGEEYEGELDELDEVIHQTALPHTDEEDEEYDEDDEDDGVVDIDFPRRHHSSTVSTCGTTDESPLSAGSGAGSLSFTVNPMLQMPSTPIIPENEVLGANSSILEHEQEHGGHDHHSLHSSNTHDSSLTGTTSSDSSNIMNNSASPTVTITTTLSSACDLAHPEPSKTMASVGTSYNAVVAPQLLSVPSLNIPSVPASPTLKHILKPSSSSNGNGNASVLTCSTTNSQPQSQCPPSPLNSLCGTPVTPTTIMTNTSTSTSYPYPYQSSSLAHQHQQHPANPNLHPNLINPNSTTLPHPNNPQSANQ
ncbi:unnamed protein product [Ambrosiozyma monospora]|uniref:Unnamed protein product n=1 Tax=Ambrosiozyma monospora TaxID=43982 RepID=A0ACB5U061_AMBMO|nr:unnamed protein product [Ambrosiozyma monospora]